MSNTNSNAGIVSQIALVQALAATSTPLTSAQMVAMFDWCIAQFALGKPVVSYAVNGRSMTFTSPEQLIKFRDYYTNASAPGDAPFISQGCEL